MNYDLAAKAAADIGLPLVDVYDTAEECGTCEGRYAIVLGDVETPYGPHAVTTMCPTCRGQGEVPAGWDCPTEEDAAAEVLERRAAARYDARAGGLA